MIASSAIERLKLFCYAMMSVVLIGTSSCHTQKNSSYAGNINSSKTNDAATSALFEQLAASYKPWTDLYVPVELSLESPKNLSISGRATMIYGKEIYISLRVIGMEVGYLYINDEYIYIVDKYHKYYYKGDYQNLVNDYDITISDLQDLLLGRAVIPGEGIVKADDIDKFTFLSTDQQWIMSPVKTIEGADWHYLASRTEPPMLTSVSLRIRGAGAMECKFTEPTVTPAGVADGITTLTLPYKRNDIIVSISWMLNDAKWDSGREIKFTPPSSSYKLLDIENTIKSMSSDN